MTAEAVLTNADETTATPAVLLALIRAAKSGDQSAFEELMIATERRVSLLAWRILGDAEEVKDALQETFLRLYRHLKRYDETRDFHGWLARITINVCRDLDQARRKRRIFAPIDDMEGDSGPSVTGGSAGLQTDIHRAIQTLPERERLVLILSDVEGMTSEEAAQVLGNTAATVRVQLSKARAKVRAWFGGARR
jgi:RNA polymerase sigma-70 factor (ECF subfamily)